MTFTGSCRIFTHLCPNTLKMHTFWVSRRKDSLDLAGTGKQLPHVWRANLLQFQPWYVQVLDSFARWKCRSPDPDNKPPAKICELPDSLLSSYFTGRCDELQQIGRVFSTSSGDPPARYAIHGMPGVGKTQLALKFASLEFERSQYTYVFWVSAASVEKLTWDFFKLMDLLRLPGRYTLDQASKLTMVRAWLEDPTVARSWLIILDNVTQETSVILRNILPRRISGGRLLFTARTTKIADVFTAPEELSQLVLQPPGIGDAVAMLSAGAGMERQGGGEASFADAEQVVRSVENLPLAIDQAASYMRDTGSSPQEVLNVYESEEVIEVS